jgi:hypothetical protein
MNLYFFAFVPNLENWGFCIKDFFLFLMLWQASSSSLRLLSANGCSGNRRFSVFNEFSEKMKGEANRCFLYCLFSSFFFLLMFCSVPFKLAPCTVMDNQ